MSAHDIEAKLVITGAQSVGKTCLIHRLITNTWLPPAQQAPTVGANFLTKRLTSPEHPNSTLRLQIWDTAGQERFRSISRLYYRGADVALLCYDITDEQSFLDLHVWLADLLRTAPPHCIVHVVGTKADVVAEDPAARQVAFERCTSFAAEWLLRGSRTNDISPQYGRSRSAPRYFPVGSSLPSTPPLAGAGAGDRTSGLWAVDSGQNNCHEISAKDGEGVEELFRVITRELIERAGHEEKDVSPGKTTANGRGDDYFEGDRGRSTFRLGLGDKRRSWLLSFPSTPAGVSGDETRTNVVESRRGRCC